MATSSAALLRCQDADVAEAMLDHVESLKKERDSIGSRVDLVVAASRWDSASHGSMAWNRRSGVRCSLFLGPSR